MGTGIAARDGISGRLFVYETCAQCGAQRIVWRPGADEIAAFYPETYYAYTGAEAFRPTLSDHFKRWIYEVFYSAREERSAVVRALRLPLAALLYPLRFRTNLAFRSPALRRVFEMGAAIGNDLLEFRAAGWQLAGCEPSAKACQVAARRGIELQNCTAEGARIAPDSQGCVLINNVFEHLHDPTAVLDKVFKGLVADGVLVLIVPNHGSWAARWFGAAWPGFDAPRHLWGFTPRSLCALLRQHGFEVDYVAHKAPLHWCWRDSIEGARLPAGVPAWRPRLAGLLSNFFIPLGVLAALCGRGDFIKVVARKPARP